MSARSLISRTIFRRRWSPFLARADSSSKERSKWSSIARLPPAVTMMICSIPDWTASWTTYWMIGLSTRGNISLGWAFVAGRKRVPQPAAVTTAFRIRIRFSSGATGEAALAHEIAHPGQVATALRRHRRRIAGGGEAAAVELDKVGGHRVGDRRHRHGEDGAPDAGQAAADEERGKG